MNIEQLLSRREELLNRLEAARRERDEGREQLARGEKPIFDKEKYYRQQQEYVAARLKSLDEDLFILTTARDTGQSAVQVRREYRDRQKKKRNREIRQKAGLTREEYDSLNLQARQALTKEYFKGRLRRTTARADAERVAKTREASQRTVTPRDETSAERKARTQVPVIITQQPSGKESGGYSDLERQRVLGVRTVSQAEQDARATQIATGKAIAARTARESREKRQATYTPPEGNYGTNITSQPEGTTAQNKFIKGAPRPKSVLREVAPRDLKDSNKWAEYLEEYARANPQTPRGAGAGALSFVVGGVQAATLGVKALTQNPYEVVTGIVGDIFRPDKAVEKRAALIQESPYAGGGAVAAEAAALFYGAYGAGRALTTKSTTGTAGATTRGRVATPEILQDRSVTPVTKDVGTQFKVAELESVDIGVASQSRYGTSVTAIETTPRFGPETFLTAEEMAQLPSAYRARASVKTRRVTSPEGPPAPGSLQESALLDKTTRAQTIMSAEDVARATEPTQRLRIVESDVPPGTRVVETGSGKAVFEAIDLSKSTTLTTKPGSTARGGRTTQRVRGDGATVEFRPSLDFWERFFLRTPQQELAVARSFATGKEVVSITDLPKTGGRPLIIKDITSTAATKQAAKAGGVAASGPTTVTTTTSGGQILEIKIAEEPTQTGAVSEPPIQEEKIKTEEVSITKDQTRGSQAQPEGRSGPQVRPATQSPSSIQRSRSRAGTGLAPTTRISFATITDTSTAQGPGTSTTSRAATTPASSLTARTASATDTIIDTTSTLQPIQTYRQRLRDYLRRGGRGRTPGKTQVLPVPPPRPPLPDDKGKSKRKGLFDVFVRRRGRFGLIGSLPTVQGAAALGARRTKKTAAASFKVVERGKGLMNVQSLVNRKDFRAAKAEPGVVVQRRGRRLSSRSEVRDVTRGKRRKIKWA